MQNSNFEQADRGLVPHLPILAAMAALQQNADGIAMTNRRTPMKKLIMGAALAALLASPAFAMSYDPEVGSGNINPSPYDVSAQNGGAFSNAYDYAPAQGERLDGIRAQATAPGVVYEDGHYIGQDPDPNVQLQLRRDWPYE
jgi:hypothetical protein